MAGSRPAGDAGAPYAPRSLGANTSWNVVAQAVYAGTQWLLLVLVTKWTDEATTGVFALALATTLPVYALLNLDLRAVQATDARERFPFGAYLAHRLVSTALAQVALVGVGWWVMDDAFGRHVLAVVGVAKGVEALSDVCYGLFQHRERMDVIAVSMIARGVAMAVGFTALMLASGDLRVALVGQAAGWALVVALHDLPRAVRFAGPAARPAFQAAGLVAITRLALPLGIVLLLGSLAYGVPRWVVEDVLGEDVLAIFAVQAYVVQVGHRFMHAVMHAAVPRLARRFAAGEVSAFARLGGGLLALASAVGVVGVVAAWAIGRPVLAWVYTPAYAAYDGLFVLVMVAGGVGYVARAVQHLLTSVRWFRAQVPLALVDLGVITAGCVVLVPAHGLDGAAWAWIASQLAVLVVGGAMLARALVVGPPREAA